MRDLQAAKKTDGFVEQCCSSYFRSTGSDTKVLGLKLHVLYDGDGTNMNEVYAMGVVQWLRNSGCSTR